MGAYAPASIVTEQMLETIKTTIIKPTLIGMSKEGRQYKGCLYVGLMITKTGPKVIEYNCRSATLKRRWCCLCLKMTFLTS